MADYLLSFGLVFAISTVVLVAVRLVAGRSRSAAGMALRIASAVAVAALVAAGLLYSLMNSRTLQLAGTTVCRVQTNEKLVALTFDDGPTPEHTREVLGVLARYNAKATFFVTGEESAEDMADLRAIVDAGHQVGNHTWSHNRLIFLRATEVQREVESTDRVIRHAAFSGPILFRTPSGKRLLTAPLYLAAHGRVNVFWDSEPDSIAAIEKDPAAMTQRVLRDVRPGSIVLMHVMYDSRGASRAALPRILDQLARRGYRFVTVNELLDRQTSQGFDAP